MRFNLLCLLFVLSFLAFNSCVPTSFSYQESRIFYAEKYQSFLEKDNATAVFSANVNYTVEKIIASNKYIYKQYQPQKVALLTYSEYKESSLKTKDGKFVMYGDDGRIMQNGNYTNNQKTGFWQDFDEKGNYINDQRHGIWHSFKVDSLGNLTDTLSIIKYEDNVLIKEEQLDSSKIITLPYLPTCEKETGKERKKCTDDNVLRAIYTNITYPRYARETGIQGLTCSSFVIDKNGQVQDIKVLRSLCNEMEIELIKAIKSLPKFETGLLNGKKKSVRFNLPVRFKLQVN
jgi:TonB family protein